MIYFLKWFVLFLLLLFLSFSFKLSISYDDFKDFAEILLNVSGVVFTVMGIWIALIYPAALSKIIDSDKVVLVDFSELRTDTKRLEFLVFSVLKSAFIVVVILFSYLFRFIVINFEIYLEFLFLFKSFAVSVLALLFFMHMESIWHVVAANIMFINDLHKKDRIEKLIGIFNFFILLRPAGWVG